MFAHLAFSRILHFPRTYSFMSLKVPLVSLSTFLSSFLGVLAFDNSKVASSIACFNVPF